jgi:hypothetical protein
MHSQAVVFGTGALTTTGLVVDYANDVTIPNPIVVNSNTTQLRVVVGTTPRRDLVLTAANTYSDPTAITADRLIMNGNSAVAVNSGAALGGTGTVGAITVNSNGTLAPGSAFPQGLRGHGYRRRIQQQVA